MAHWTCPFCDRDTIVRNGDFMSKDVTLDIQNANGKRWFVLESVVCPNPKCRQFTLSLFMYEMNSVINVGQTKGELIKSWNLIPPSHARVFPEYVPEPIRHDYEEACLIRDLSPKASATLARRALQGMIRDYWKISKGRLVDEVDALEDKIDPVTWQAIDAVRKIGNIGAHMEKDINVIVEVEPEEADQLLHLIEILVKDWYVTRHDREERFKGVIALQEAKAEAKKAPPGASE